MSYLKTKSPENAVFEGFSGIDTRFSHAKTPRASDVCNFRICDDGSLKKRCGFRHSVSIAEEIRTVWTGKLGGEEKCFLLHGNKVSLYDKASDSISNIGVVGTTVGRACFFYYRDRLYLADGQKIYEMLFHLFFLFFDHTSDHFATDRTGFTACKVSIVTFF